MTRLPASLDALDDAIWKAIDAINGLADNRAIAVSRAGEFGLSRQDIAAAHEKLVELQREAIEKVQAMLRPRPEAFTEDDIIDGTTAEAAAFMIDRLGERLKDDLLQVVEPLLPDQADWERLWKSLNKIRPKNCGHLHFAYLQVGEDGRQYLRFSTYRCHRWSCPSCGSAKRLRMAQALMDMIQKDKCERGALPVTAISVALVPDCESHLPHKERHTAMKLRHELRRNGMSYIILPWRDRETDEPYNLVFASNGASEILCKYTDYAYQYIFPKPGDDMIVQFKTVYDYILLALVTYVVSMVEFDKGLTPEGTRRHVRYSPDLTGMYQMRVKRARAVTRLFREFEFGLREPDGENDFSEEEIAEMVKRMEEERKEQSKAPRIKLRPFGPVVNAMPDGETLMLPWALAGIWNWESLGEAMSDAGFRTVGLDCLPARRYLSLESISLVVPESLQYDPERDPDAMKLRAFFEKHAIVAMVRYPLHYRKMRCYLHLTGYVLRKEQAAMRPELKIIPRSITYLGEFIEPDAQPELATC